MPARPGKARRFLLRQRRVGVEAVTLERCDRVIGVAQLRRVCRGEEHAVATQITVDRVLTGEGFDLGDRVFRSTHQADRLALTEQSLQGQELGCPREHAAADAAARPGATGVGLEHDDVRAEGPACLICSAVHTARVAATHDPHTSAMVSPTSGGNTPGSSASALTNQKGRFIAAIMAGRGSSARCGFIVAGCVGAFLAAFFPGAGHKMRHYRARVRPDGVDDASVIGPLFRH